MFHDKRALVRTALQLLSLGVLLVWAKCASSNDSDDPVASAAPRPGLFVVPSVDVSAWRRVPLAAFGEAATALEGSLLLPADAETRSVYMTDETGVHTGQMFQVTLRDGVEVWLGVRRPALERDPSLLKQLLSDVGPFVIDRTTPTGYMLVQQRAGRFVVQGAMWQVEPGLTA